MSGSFTQFLYGRRRTALVAVAGTMAFLMLVIIVLLSLLLVDKPVEADPNVISGGEPELHGPLSADIERLFGKTVSTRNLKGLTLRINQIETCNTSAISAYVAVSTSQGIVNKNFRKADVKAYIDGKEFTNFDFKPVDTNASPISNAVVIDHSGSMLTNNALGNAKVAATDYVQKLKPADSVAVIQFDDRVDTLVSLTKDKSAAIAAIAGIQARGDTAIYDAIDQGVGLLPSCGRKAVTILTDGDDTASKAQNQMTVIERANKANLPIFSVGVKGLGFNPASISTISSATGGQYLEANSPAEIAALYDRINGQLTGQFVATLKLNMEKDGKPHTLRIVSTVEGSPTSSERSFIY